MQQSRRGMLRTINLKAQGPPESSEITARERLRPLTTTRQMNSVILPLTPSVPDENRPGLLHALRLTTAGHLPGFPSLPTLLLRQRLLLLLAPRPLTTRVERQFPATRPAKLHLWDLSITGRKTHSAVPPALQSAMTTVCLSLG